MFHDTVPKFHTHAHVLICIVKYSSTHISMNSVLNTFFIFEYYSKHF